MFSASTGRPRAQLNPPDAALGREVERLDRRGREDAGLRVLLHGDRVDDRGVGLLELGDDDEAAVGRDEEGGEIGLVRGLLGGGALLEEPAPQLGRGARVDGAAGRVDAEAERELGAGADVGHALAGAHEQVERRRDALAGVGGAGGGGLREVAAGGGVGCREQRQEGDPAGHRSDLRGGGGAGGGVSGGGAGRGGAAPAARPAARTCMVALAAAWRAVQTGVWPSQPAASRRRRARAR